MQVSWVCTWHPCCTGYVIWSTTWAVAFPQAHRRRLWLPCPLWALCVVEELGPLKKEGGMGAACRDGRVSPRPPLNALGSDCDLLRKSKWGFMPVCQAGRDAIVTGGPSAILIEVMRSGLEVKPIQIALGALRVRLFALLRATQAAVQVRQLRH